MYSLVQRVVKLSGGYNLEDSYHIQIKCIEGHMRDHFV